MPHARDYEATDKAALRQALLNLHTCPECRDDLRPVALFDQVWWCERCRESFYIPVTES